jgi:hypothetical protein
MTIVFYESCHHLEFYVPHYFRVLNIKDESIVGTNYPTPDTNGSWTMVLVSRIDRLMLISILSVHLIEN